jgi:hypothetical protein
VHFLPLNVAVGYSCLEFKVDHTGGGQHIQVHLYSGRLGNGWLEHRHPHPEHWQSLNPSWSRLGNPAQLNESPFKTIQLGGVVGKVEPLTSQWQLFGLSDMFREGSQPDPPPIGVGYRD